MTGQIPDRSNNDHSDDEGGAASALNEVVSRVLGQDWASKSLDELMDERVRADLGSMSRVNILLFGRPGVGKSTLVNAILRKPLAPVGVGRSTTLEIKEYSDPTLPIRIFDTRGIDLDGDPDRTLAEINEKIDAQYRLGEDEYIHLALYCVLEGSWRFLDSEEALVRSMAGKMPVLLVFTQCYDDDAEPSVRQFQADVLSRDMPVVGRRIFRTIGERRRFGKASIEPYGLDRLAKAMYEVLPVAKRRAFVNGQAVDIAMKVAEAHKSVIKFSGLATGVGALPIPIIDTAPLTTLQVAMIAEINTTMGLEVDTAAVAASLLPILGTAVVGRSVVKTILTFVPVAGWAINGGIAGSLTAALGEWYIHACARALRRVETPGALTASDIQVMILEELTLAANSWKASASRVWERAQLPRRSV